MANPNIINVTTINGATSVLLVTTTPTAIVSNAAASGKIYKISSLIISNVDGTNNATVNVDIFRSSVAYHIAKTVVVPADASIDLFNKTIYLMEGDDLRLTANVDLDLEAVCSYEEIS